MSRFATDAHARLRERGCLCGTDRAAQCSLHGPGDNRGIRAYFEAGMPSGFPMDATCTICRAGGLLYPSVELDRGEVPAGQLPRSTFVCPSCSSGAAAESFLRFEAEEFGYELNESRVFAGVPS